MASFRDLLSQTKARIREVDTEQAEQDIARPGAVVLDVREPDEYEQGALPGAVHIPRGHLESQIENKVVDRDAPVVVYCAGGTRSAFAADTLSQLGYTDVVSVVGGFNKWKNEGRAWSTPRTLTPGQRNRYQRHLLLPEVGEEGQQSCSTRRSCCSAPAASGRPRRCTSPPPAWAPSASSTWTWSTSRTSSARSSTTSTGSVTARSTRPRRR
jgi:rhodanese-related sulfurtransferase